MSTQACGSPSARMTSGRWFTLLVVTMPLLWTIACTAPPEATTPRTDTAQETRRAPDAPLAHDFTLTALDGEPISLHELRGRWVVLNFWATWCKPCREEMPYLQELADTYVDDLAVLGVNMREEAAALRPFVAEVGISFPVLLQPDDAMLMAYGPRGLPLTYVIDPNGVVAYQQYGPLQPAQFDTWLADHVGQTTLATPE